ncbi:unnamed protein product [Ceutorhynchus assimilis]|uniref:Uncharacterized protein n=1 Tax=Ceutorhynchus assimilis TaxID=467358 RepID=A0A9N9N2G3_9CUCU|nr:unnamed protein product [Ceutorhynchus assimilis]
MFPGNLRFIRDASKEIHHRMILKNGQCNVSQPISKRQRLIVLRYSQLVDSSWTFTLTIFLAVLFVSWTIFAIFYWLICLTHGDFEPNHLPEMQKVNNFKPCIYDMRDFSSAFLFSMEAQHTVGYGIKAPTDECAEALFVNTLHCIMGFIMQGFMAAVMFSKMTKPRVRSQTLWFSKNAVISLRNGKLCLMFRVGDIRPHYIVDARIRVFLVKFTKTLEHEPLPHTQTELKIHVDGCLDNMFFNWPMVMCHVIDEESPLYYLSPSDLSQRKFEIMVIIEGTEENTGQVTQAKSSYMPDEILWGCRFDSLMKFNDLREEYEVDFSKFHTVVPVSTPLCSAVYNEQYHSMEKSNKNGSSNIRLDFRPRQSVGEIPANQLVGLRERSSN